MKKENTNFLIKMFDKSLFLKDFSVRSVSLALKKKGTLNILSRELLEWG